MVGALTDVARHVLLAGGGHAHAVALRNLARKPPTPPLQITLLNPSTHNMYSGALPGVIAGHWSADAIGVDMPSLCTRANVTFIEDSVISLDPDKQTAVTASGRTMAYDLLSLDIGSRIRPIDADKCDECIVPIRPIGSFLGKWHDALEAVQNGEHAPSVMIIGAGLAGIEVALAVQYRLNAMFGGGAQTILIEQGDTIAKGSHPALRTRLIRALRRANISVLTGTRLLSCESGTARLSDRRSFDAALIVNCAGSAPHAWLSQSGLTTYDGRITVDAHLRSTSHPHVLAAGDTTWFSPAPVAPAGVFAVRAGPVIAENIRRYARNQPFCEFHPQSDYLKLVSLGGKRAIAEKYGMAFEGDWVWKLKKRIDFSFLHAHNPASGN